MQTNTMCSCSATSSDVFTRTLPPLFAVLSAWASRLRHRRVYAEGGRQQTRVRVGEARLRGVERDVRVRILLDVRALARSEAVCSPSAESCEGSSSAWSSHKRFATGCKRSRTRGSASAAKRSASGCCRQAMLLRALFASPTRCRTVLRRPHSARGSASAFGMYRDVSVHKRE